MDGIRVRNVIVGVVILVLISACVIVTVWLNGREGAPGAGSEPAPGVTPQGTPEVTEEDAIPTEDNADNPQPSSDRVWLFEEAYYTPDPIRQLELLSDIALSEYIENEYSSEPRPGSDIVNSINRDLSSSSMSCDQARTHCTVTTFASITSSRNGEIVLAFTAQHTTAWVYVLDEWWVVSEVR
jgi:hypothetical protein